jgi:hypothetical protein
MRPSNFDRLLREVAEASYRRGFQQGHDTAMGEHELTVDLHRWRFDVPLTRSPSPIGHRPTDALERLEIEAPELAARLRRLIEE